MLLRDWSSGLRVYFFERYMDLILVIFIGATLEQKFDDVDFAISGRNAQGGVAVLSRKHWGD